MHSASSLDALDGDADVPPRLVVESRAGAARAGCPTTSREGAMLGPRRRRDPARGPVRLLPARAPHAPGRDPRHRGPRLDERHLPQRRAAARAAAAAPRRPRPHRRLDVHLRRLRTPMLRVASDHFSHSDTGRARRANEDAYFARSPVFVVADGMGGAQAGEVASRLAIEAFERGLGDGAGASGEELLAERVQEANQRIHEMSQAAHGPRRDGHDDHGRARRRPRRRDRPRRRLARLPPARRGVHAPDRGPLARRGDAPPRPAHRAGGRRAPAALDHHARARARARRRRRHALLARRGRRRLPAVQRRADVDGARVAGRRHRARGEHAARRRPRAHRRRQRRPAGATTSRSSCFASRRSARATTGARAADLGRRHAARDHADVRAAAAARRRRRTAPPSRRPPPRARAAAAAIAGAPVRRRRRRAPSAPPAADAPARRPAASAAAGACVKVFAIVALILIPLGFGAYSANAGGLLRRHERRGLRDALPRAAVLAARRRRPVHGQLRLRRADRDAAAPPAASSSSTTRCAPTTTRPISSASSSAAASPRERPQPRALRADPGVAARDGRLRRGLHPARRPAVGPVADLRR